MNSVKIAICVLNIYIEFSNFICQCIYLFIYYLSYMWNKLQC